MTRLDCVLGSAGTMRAAVAQAVHHATQRSAFGGVLRDKPLMSAVLADLALESEAATVLGLRLAAAVDAGEDDFGRLATAVAKFWVCKRAPVVAAEALECLGGNGYVEESGMPRLLRESPLNSIWEGSGNVIALDVLRAVAREPAAVAAVLAEISAADDSRVSAPAQHLGGALAGPRAGGGGRGLAARGGRCRAGGARPGWRWRCRPRCSSGTPPASSRTRSARPGSRTARPASSGWACRARRRWWTGPHRPAKKFPPSCREGRCGSDPLVSCRLSQGDLP